ncbi:MAG: hypothetical protein EAZ51_01215 [Sphingobacteriales bacterium]|nr:MAG: hypothetical protein EAZ64_01745 [Sphingobacteriales bacterium]TAF83170.1 MAG: hypothetical protein EAZ51_01215 [Sphingobacteriales bacterium]
MPAILETLVKLITIAGIVIAVFTYLKNTKLSQAKWLSELFEKFYEKETYKEVRLLIDYKTAQYQNLINSIKADTEPELQEKLVDYLNFFEFISTLNVEKQLSLRQINLVFGYYINAISQSEEIMDFIKKSGFQNLPDLIRSMNNLRSN